VKRGGWLGLALAVLGAACASCAEKAPIESTGAAEVAAAQRLVIDVRLPDAFAEGHLPGALNIQLGWGQLEGRTRSYVPDLAQPLAVRAGSLSDAEKAAAILKNLGYKDYKRIEPTPGEETATLPLMTAAELESALDGPDAPIVLDIRTQSEFDDGTIDGATLINEDHGPEAVKDLDPNGHYAIICAGGWRSSQLATWMENHGFTDVTNVIDGMSAWYDLD
jgi:rhodanese-related sulfurtransferase